MTISKEEWEWALQFAQDTYGYEFSESDVKEIIEQAKEAEKKEKQKDLTAFVIMMTVIVNNNYKNQLINKKLNQLVAYLEQRNLTVDGATKEQLQLLVQYNLMRADLAYHFTEQSQRAMELGLPTDYKKTVSQVIKKGNEDSLKAFGQQFSSIKNGQLPNTKSGIVDYLLYKNQLYASDRPPNIQVDYDYYRKLYTEKLKNAVFKDNMTDEEVKRTNQAIKQAVNSANRVNRFDLMTRHNLNKLDALNEQDGFKKGRGIYRARAAADQDCKAHQQVVMTFDQFMNIYPVHPNCMCTLEVIPPTMSDKDIMDNMMNDDGAIPETAKIYKKAGTSYYPDKENIGNRTENKYKFQFEYKKGHEPKSVAVPVSSMSKNLAHQIAIRDNAIYDIKKSIGTDKYPLKIKETKQAQHDPNSERYVKGNSFFKEGIDIQELVNKWAGHGTFRINSKGIWIRNFEYIDTGEFIGYVYDKQGNLIPTTKIRISYSKKGYHAFPDNP